MKTKEVVLLGGGGHALVLLAIYNQKLAERQVHALLESPSDRLRQKYPQIMQVVQDDRKFIEDHAPGIALNGIGLIDNSVELRRAVYELFSGHGWQFVTLDDPSANICHDVVLGQGSQVMAGAIIQTDVTVGENCVINTGAIIEHECRLDSHCIIGPGAVLCGNVTVGSGSVIGPGSTILPGVSVPPDTLVPAMSRITKREAKLL